MSLIPVETQSFPSFTLHCTHSHSYRISSLNIQRHLLRLSSISLRLIISHITQNFTNLARLLWNKVMMNPQPTPNPTYSDLDPNDFPSELKNLIHQVNEAVKAARICYERSKNSPPFLKDPTVEVLKRARAVQAFLGGSAGNFIQALADWKDLGVSFSRQWASGDDSDGMLGWSKQFERFDWRVWRHHWIPNAWQFRHPSSHNERHRSSYSQHRSQPRYRYCPCPCCIHNG